MIGIPKKQLSKKGKNKSKDKNLSLQEIGGKNLKNAARISDLGSVHHFEDESQKSKSESESDSVDVDEGDLDFLERK